MKYQVLTLFPELIQPLFDSAMVHRAQEKKLIDYEIINPRSFTSDTHQSVDDRPFGGGDGMLMMYEPLEKALSSLSDRGRVIYLSPQGRPLTDTRVRELSQESTLTLICGRYGGIDQRLINDHVDEEISIGDYVLSGGELAANVLIDAITRQIPGVLGHQESAGNDSFANGLLEAPHFTQPREIGGQGVPEVLLSGHHERIRNWRKQLSVLVTLKKRPDIPIDEKDLNAARETLAGVSDEELRLCGLKREDFR